MDDKEKESSSPSFLNRDFGVENLESNILLYTKASVMKIWRFIPLVVINLKSTHLLDLEL